jgi:putative endonuclease
VAEFLLAKGYVIVTRRFKTAHGELDLVALDGDELVMVEVKARFAGGVPEEAVGELKARRLRMAAVEYLRSMEEPERAYRFDLVAVTPGEIRHYERIF